MSSSQLDPLPANLPFRFISKTIGRGAYASIKKAIPLDSDNPIFAVKLIHKGYAVKHGRISPKQIAMEVSLHSHVGQHPNIIEWFATGEDDVWRWIAMEYAEGGDLFDKIEADVGVHPDIAQIYFHQLVAGVSYMHSKGVSHRDLKPENILLSDAGNLKIADFGMATMFEYRGQRKQSSTICGSPPYVAPEVLRCARAAGITKKAAAAGGTPSPKYDPEMVDIWSCGVILFVLLCGNTPWDEPTSNSWEFQEYLRHNGRSTDPLWEKVPPEALSLLRGMMALDPSRRFGMTKIRQHPWCTRPNPHMNDEGKISDPLQVATKMLERLRIDFSKPTPHHPTVGTYSQSSDAMDIDDAPGGMSSTQPEVPISDPFFDFDRPSRPTHQRSSQPNPNPISSTQPLAGSRVPLTSRPGAGGSFNSNSANAMLLANNFQDDPSMSQFSQAPGVPLTLTQHARRFRDLVPAYGFTRFVSAVPPNHLIQLLTDALHNLSVPVASVPVPDMSTSVQHVAMIRVRAVSERKQSLHGEIVVDRYYMCGADDGGAGAGMELLEVQFVKIKGDPLEWRRFFKNMVLLCRDGVFRPET